MDWGLGAYECVAGGLLPAARAVIGRAAPGVGDHVVDIGCGTGNAALLAAARGARVTGVDPSQRLLDLATAEAAARGLDVSFVRGEAGALPLADACADVVVSVFGVIFAPDAEAAVAEMGRIAGREIVFSAWLPGGAMADVAGVLRQARPAAGGGRPASFSWHDGATLAGAFAPHGFSVELSTEQLAFTGASAAEFADAELRDHPLWAATKGALEIAGRLPPVRARVVEILDAANEDPGGFSVTSRYVIATARRA